MSEKPIVALRSYLRELFAENGGRISFEQFMGRALYDPVHGYYTTNIRDVGGGRADFSTWATLSNFGETITSWIRGELAFHQPRPSQAPRAIIEVGGGDGSLARDIWKSIGWRWRSKLSYHLVEISGPLQTLQRKKLGGRAFHWHDSIRSALTANAGRAIVFSNELADAFPVTWLRWNEGRWEEIFVDYHPDSGLKESFQHCEWVPDLPHPVVGQRVEMHLSYRRWLEDWLPLLSQGSFLTIDYGALSATEIYQGRPQGTMRAYYQQQRIEGGGIYERFGRQDLTCDVNFSHLDAWGKSAGLQTVALEDLESFTRRFRGKGTFRPDAARTFQVLWQRRN